MIELFAIYEFTAGGVTYKKGDVVNGYHELPRADQFKYRKFIGQKPHKSPAQLVEDLRKKAESETDTLNGVQPAEKVSDEVKE